MQTAMKEGQQVEAALAFGKGFTCVACGGPVLLRKGVRGRSARHFVHAFGTCSHEAGVTDRVIRCKHEVYRNLELLQGQKVIGSLGLERDLKGLARPDIRFSVESTLVAVEVLREGHPPEEVHRVTDLYTSLGVYVLWLYPSKPRQDILLRYVQRLYGGRVYDWKKGLLVRASHYKKGKETFGSVISIHEFMPVGDTWVLLWADPEEDWW